jgi:hypothetical protein
MVLLHWVAVQVAIHQEELVAQVDLVVAVDLTVAVAAEHQDRVIQVAQVTEH